MGYLGNRLTSGKDFIFEELFELILHEMMHMFGFSGSKYRYWINPETGREYGYGNEPVVKRTLREKETTILTTKHIKEWT